VGARSARLLTIGLMLATVGLASACAGQPVVTVAPTVPSAAVSAPGAPAAPVAPPESAPAEHGAHVPAAAPAEHGAHAPGAAPAEPAAPAPAPAESDAVNCGKVGPTGGQQVDLIAEATDAGTVGCTEAINVISQYYHDAAVQVPGDGTSRIREIGKWTCAIDTGGPVSSRQIGCGNDDGFAMHTQP
jgi:hypothetical protein